MQIMKQQRGGTLLGFIFGVLAGLAAALAVAVYVTKVPIPFVNKGQVRSADQDVTETQKNKDWDPNAPLYGKTPLKPAQSAPADPSAADLPATAATAPASEFKPAVSSDPLGDLAKARSADAPVDAFNYFVQAGAFRSADDAESQRAKLSLSGVQARVTEREQSGRVVFRVRVGPFDNKKEADEVKQRLDAAGMETALVRVQR